MATLLRKNGFMTDTPEISPDDPRYGFAVVTSTVRGLIDGTTPEQFGDSTPCPDFSVKDLLEHINLVMQRVAALGNGEHWSSVTPEGLVQENGHADTYATAAHDVMNAWTDSAKLEQMFEVPWGELPGGPMLLTYTAELATHGWDLATATGQSIEVPDEMLGGALMAAQMLPSEGRDDPEFPFDPVVDPGEDAPTLLKIAGWMGRQVV